MTLKEKKLIVGVSGGPDSMALLNKYRKQIVLVCHVNYHKRPDSDHDQKVVTDFCKKHAMCLLVKSVNGADYKKSKQHNFQTWARQIRYDFFAEAGRSMQCNNLLLAHNLNDFIETAIMQENRKSKNFFYGIKPINKYKNLSIYRPLIKVFKSDLEKYCKTNHVPYAIDSSNASDIYERNRIRKQLSKLSRVQLLKLYKKFQERNEQQAKLEKQVEKVYKEWLKEKCSVNFFLQIKSNLKEPLIYVYLKNNGINNVNYNKIKLVRDYIVSKKSNNHLRLEDNVLLCKKDKKIKIVNKTKKK